MKSPPMRRHCITLPVDLSRKLAAHRRARRGQRREFNLSAFVTQCLRSYLDKVAPRAAP